MLLSRAVSLVGVGVLLAGPVAAHASPGGVDLVPVLTSTPFGAVGGQPVTHTIVVSGTGTGTVTGVRVTFTTTAGLDRAVASTSQGRCSIADDRTVVCDLGVVAFPSADTAPPKVTINGTVTPGSLPGVLVQNVVMLASTPADADVSNNAASNAYLIPGPSVAPTSGAAAAPASASTAQTPGYLLAVAAAVLVLALLAGLLLLRRRRR